MKLDGKINYDELSGIIYNMKELIIGTFLKKVYHYEGLWLFKFNKFQFVYDNGISLWPGNFIEREKNIHSICVKLRHDLLDKKVTDIYIKNQDRTLIIKFYDYFLIFEFFAKGNLILCDKNSKILVLTRPNEHSTHNETYDTTSCGNLVNKKMYCVKENYEYKIDNEKGDLSIIEVFELLWNVKKQKVFKKEEIKNRNDKKQNNIENQIIKYEKNIIKFNDNIEELENTDEIDFKKLNKVYDDMKIAKKKLEKAHEAKNKKNIQKKKEYIEVIHSKWYHDYYWWFTKNGYLVVGGKNAEQNEKLVKSYMKDYHYYFHSEMPGSGSFLLLKEENDIINDVDIVDTANGVLALSQNWKTNRTGKVYWVYGHQVSKTPPSGEYLVKGSFMVRGNRNYISVHELALGYCIYENQIMLAPYSIIRSFPFKVIKLIPKTTTKKGSQKEIHKKIIDYFCVKIIPENVVIFSHPCLISTNDFSKN
jgi:predicted ribosome quality control (RQC) complex YloA/Tae2 family protein